MRTVVIAVLGTVLWSAPAKAQPEGEGAAPASEPPAAAGAAAQPGEAAAPPPVPSAAPPGVQPPPASTEGVGAPLAGGPVTAPTPGAIPPGPPPPAIPPGAPPPVVPAETAPAQPAPPGDGGTADAGTAARPGTEHTVPDGGRAGEHDAGDREGGQGRDNFWTNCGPQLLMLGVMFAIFYFLLIRPQQKKAKEHQEMLRQLKRGDKVITNGGIFGTITGIDDKVAVIEVSEKVRIKVLRSHLAARADAGMDPGSK